MLSLIFFVINNKIYENEYMKEMRQEKKLKSPL